MKLDIINHCSYIKSKYSQSRKKIEERGMIMTRVKELKIAGTKKNVILITSALSRTSKKSHSELSYIGKFIKFLTKPKLFFL